MRSRPIELREQITVPRSRSDCFRYLADFSTVEQWDPSVRRAEKLTDGAPAEGSRFRLSLRFAGRSLTMDYELRACQRDRALELHGRGDGFEVVDRIGFEDAGTDADGAPRTRIDYHASVTLDTSSSLARWFVERIMGHAGRQAVEGIGAALRIPRETPTLGAARSIADRMLLPAMRDFTEAGYRRMPDKSLSEFIDGRVVVVTGATGGLGLAAAEALSRLGAHTVLVGRDTERLKRAAERVRASAGAAADQVGCVEADLLTIDAARRAATEIGRRFPRVDVLLNNAGALFNRRGETADGHEQSLAINLIAPWVLTRTLMPALRAARGRVIGMASGGLYTQPLRLDDLQYRDEAYNGPKAYARAKRGLVAVTEHWARTEPDVDFHAMHPGWAATPGVADALPAFDRALKGRLRDARHGADTAVWLASARAVRHDSGRFWFDRRPRATALLPGTAHSRAETDALVRWLADRTGC